MVFKKESAPLSPLSTEYFHIGIRLKTGFFLNCWILCCFYLNKLLCIIKFNAHSYCRLWNFDQIFQNSIDRIKFLSFGFLRFINPSNFILLDILLFTHVKYLNYNILLNWIKNYLNIISVNKNFKHCMC